MWIQASTHDSDAIVCHSIFSQLLPRNYSYALLTNDKIAFICLYMQMSFPKPIAPPNYANYPYLSWGKKFATGTV